MSQVRARVAPSTRRSRVAGLMASIGRIRNHIMCAPSMRVFFCASLLLVLTCPWAEDCGAAVASARLQCAFPPSEPFARQMPPPPLLPLAMATRPAIRDQGSLLLLRVPLQPLR